MRGLKDAIYGLAVGDALGLPVQFKARDTYQISKMTGYGTFGLPAGSWSDDTSLTLATCDSIRACGCVDPADIRKRFEDWLLKGCYTPFGEAYDIGRTCEEAIRSKAGGTDPWSNGNGSLMRILPLAFVPGITREQVKAVSAITHAHPRAIEGCVIYIQIAKALLEGKALKGTILNAVEEGSVYERLRRIEQLSREEIRSSGYVVDTLEAAIWCLMTTGSYEECVLKAVNLGEDTDTVGAVAGGLAGICYGFERIPQEWIGALQKREEIENCLFKLPV